MLDETYRPGMLLAATPIAQLVRIPDGENELTFSSFSYEGTALTFRFHSEESHLVGIAETDRTDELVVDEYLHAPNGQRFAGLLELIEYDYGDGLTFLYSPSRNHLQFQCRILDLSPE